MQQCRTNLDHGMHATSLQQTEVLQFSPEEENRHRMHDENCVLQG